MVASLLLKRLRTCLAIAFYAVDVCATFQDFGIPPSNAIVEIRAFNVVNLTSVTGSHQVFAPVLPGHVNLTVPVHSFLIEHKSSHSRLLFDLGVRKDPWNYPPAISAFFAAGIYSVPNDFKDIGQLLEQGGISISSIDAVIWSHSHLDHIGDMSKFPNTTTLVIGPGTNKQLYPEYPDGVLQASDFGNRSVHEVNFHESTLMFSGLEAIDYFEDGSLYLLNTPGHLPGHLAVLARVTPSSFILLGGDSFHHPGQLRPRPRFQLHFPCPAHLRETTRSSISTDYFWSWGSQKDNFDTVSRAEPLLAISDLADSVYADPVTAKVSVEKVATFDADPDFLVIIAHDTSLMSHIPYFPAALNNWKESKWKEDLVWRFVDENNPAFVFSPK
ncbi:Metallo-beta-lactamase superfamily protein [Mycena sanguinolenta]|uniref:Metallo-beta-lactamase superfamily protein n=1 Tax=Mycena sanguinolenta TaxID=230812 RepID=A0A8H6Z563_9AGAR|nr:Metallo-beta-lactamase superfamily protein [Mycena sanguinolenta]